MHRWFAWFPGRRRGRRRTAPNMAAIHRAETRDEQGHWRKKRYRYGRIDHHRALPSTLGTVPPCQQSPSGYAADQGTSSVSSVFSIRSPAQQAQQERPNHETNSYCSCTSRCEYSGLHANFARDVAARPERPKGSGPVTHHRRLLAPGRGLVGSRAWRWDWLWDCGRCAHRCCLGPLGRRRLLGRLPRLRLWAGA